MANLQSTTIAGGLTEKGIEKLVDRSSTMFTDSTASNFTTSAILYPVIAFNPVTWGDLHKHLFVIAYADADDGNKGKDGNTITNKIRIMIKVKVMVTYKSISRTMIGNIYGIKLE